MPFLITCLLAAGIGGRKLWQHVRARRNWSLRSDEEKWTTAVHEAGHTLIAWQTPTVRKVKATLLCPYKDMLGCVAIDFYPGGRDGTPEAKAMSARINLGGMAAEKLIFGREPGDSSHDLLNAYARALSLNNGESHVSNVRQVMEIIKILGSPRPSPSALLAAHFLHLITTRWFIEALRMMHLQSEREKILKLVHALMERKTLRHKDIEAILGPRPPKPEQ